MNRCLNRLKVLLPAILLIIFPIKVSATPEKVEVWFLSAEKIGELQERLRNMDRPIYFSKLTQSDQAFECIPMGDGCFHPQRGYLEEAPGKMKVEEEKGPISSDEVPALKPEEKIEDKTIDKLKTFNSADVDMVKCDKDNYFDIFCGKAGTRAAFSPMEIWVDVSGSFKTLDYTAEAGYCKRRRFISHVLDSCPKDAVSVSVFNTSIKTMGSLEGVCMGYGTNDQNRFIDWVKGSGAKELLVITDVDELSQKMVEYLNSIGATLKGADTENITTADILNLSKSIISSCKKFSK